MASPKFLPVVAQFPKGATGVASGIQFTCALFGPTSMQCLGKGSSGQLGNGASLQSSAPVNVRLPEGSAVLSLAVKYNHICALGLQGALWCWGENISGQLGNGTTTNSNIPVQVPEPRAN